MRINGANPPRVSRNNLPSKLRSVRETHTHMRERERESIGAASLRFLQLTRNISHTSAMCFIGGGLWFIAQVDALWNEGHRKNNPFLFSVPTLLSLGRHSNKNCPPISIIVLVTLFWSFEPDLPRNQITFCGVRGCRSKA